MHSEINFPSFQGGNASYTFLCKPVSQKLIILYTGHTQLDMQNLEGVSAQNHLIRLLFYTYYSIIYKRIV